MAIRSAQVAFLLALFACSSSSAFGVSSSLGATSLALSSADKNRPVSKVTALLKDMLKQLEKEAEEDEEIYDKMACWCETNDKEKTQSVKDAQARIEDLTTQIEELTANSAQVDTELKNYEGELASDQKALDKSTALWQKQTSESNEEEKDLLGSISALKAAITILKKHQGSSLLQLRSSRRSTVASTLRTVMAKHAKLLKGSLTPSQRRSAMSFLQADGDYFDAAPTFKQSYAPQSGEIFGILTQMLETFEANLATTVKEEKENTQSYQDLKSAKTTQINSEEKQIDKKTQQLADTNEKLAQAKEDLADTKASLAKDEEFLAMLKEKCSMTDSEWNERQKTRQQEMEAVSKALAVLSGDDAHDLFTKTFNPSLLQTASRGSSKAQASQWLATAARRLSSPRLSLLATRVRLDAFTKVKAAINEMIAQLGKEKAEEFKKKDWCEDEFNTNTLQTQKKERTKTEVLAQIEDLESTVKQLTGAMDNLKSEVKEMEIQRKRAGEDREKANKDFQTTVADQRATQKLLKAALTILDDFYGKKGAALLQNDGPAPPAGFDAYKKNSASGDVMSMIEKIIQDAKTLEAEAVRSEEDAQKAYEDFVKETNGSIEAKGKQIVNKSEEKAKAEGELVEAKKSKDATTLELEQLANYKAQLHQSCDFVLKNFDVRQTARDEEVSALKQALAILSGA
mmetsp:Transcript_29119/g.73550  ORF Transcript_29119/g.73550 Transcript_29119/m.73550 type:complete len:686 (-) Transcript_29119:215-2272(-)